MSCSLTFFRRGRNEHLRNVCKVRRYPVRAVPVRRLGVAVHQLHGKEKMNAFETMVWAATLIVLGCIYGGVQIMHEHEETVRASFCPHYIERPAEHAPIKAK